MSVKLSNKQVKAEAKKFGFFACGIARAEAIAEDEAAYYRESIRRGYIADMDYLAKNVEKRLDPRLLVEGTRSIISGALNYTPSAQQHADSYHLAAYALGKDYHDVMRERLTALAKQLNLNSFRVFCDTAPVKERYWAWKAGLGWIGRNHQLIIPNAGSMFFLGEIFTDEIFDYDEPQASRCGNCRKCIDHCPTGALHSAEDETYAVAAKRSWFDARRCLSYLTIENRGAIPDEFAACMGDFIYGCDRCQTACPHQRLAKPNDIAAFQPSEALLDMTKEAWQNLDVETYRNLFRGSAVKRAKFDGLKRNIDAVVKHNKTCKQKNDNDITSN